MDMPVLTIWRGFADGAYDPAQSSARPRRIAAEPRWLQISSAYGYAPACGLLRGCRAQELLAGGGASRRHPAGGEPPDPRARGAPRPAAPRPLRAAGRADRGGDAPLPRRAEAADARGAARRRGLRLRGGSANRAARDRRLDRPRRLGPP